MRRAIRLSLRGFPAPNPRVGCVIVNRGAAVGEGWHAFAGGPHAEAMALGAAGDSARGATVYVTLEPCNHQGRTPPCARALIEAGVAEVHYACADPNPRVAGGGGVALAEAGVRVREGLLCDEAAETNRPWLAAQAMRRPFVAAKAGVSLDGRIALPSGESKWITGEKARRKARALRAEYGAVLVGRRTVELDDPKLTARTRGVRNPPLRLVLDPRRVLSGGETVFSQPGTTIRIVDSELARDADLGAPTRGGQIDLALLLAELWERGVTALLVEGGGHTIGSFLRAGLVDRIELFVAPKVLGAGPTWTDGALPGNPLAAPGFSIRQVRKLGDDLWIRAERSGSGGVS